MRLTPVRILLLASIVVVSAAGYAGLHTLAETRHAVSQAKSDPPASSSNPADAPVLYFAKDPEAAPPVETRDLSGKSVSLEALRGKVVILNFWATWCGPCREEIPEMIALEKEYKGKLAVIGASEDDSPPEKVAAFAKSIGINYPVIMSNEKLDVEYGGVVALPTSFLIDPQGRVVQKNVGVYSQTFYELQVRALLGMPVDARIETFEDTGQIFLKNADRATQLPGVSFAGLTPAQRKLALRQLNTVKCKCGCDLTLAECRISDPACAMSQKQAQEIVQEIAHSGSSARSASAPAGSSLR